MRIKNCIVCNSQFTEPDNSKTEKTTCSNKCYLFNYRILTGRALPVELRNCTICGTEFTAKKKASITCSRKCVAKLNNNKLSAKKNIKAIEGIEHDVPVCLICGHRARALHSHVLANHNLSVTQYKEKFNVDDAALYHSSYLTELSQRVSGELNPAFAHGGKFSAVSTNFIGYSSMTEEETTAARMDIAAKIAKTRKDNNNNTTTLEYYTTRGLSEDAARESLALRQTTFSLEVCIAKHGELKGKKIWQERQVKWNTSYKKNNYSKVSQELFWQILNSEELRNNSGIQFATSIDNGINNETTLKLSNFTVVKPDFFDAVSNTVIEFYGDYWHSEARGNQLRDKKREDAIRDTGYRLLIILERDYRKNPTATLQLCIDYLNQT